MEYVALKDVCKINMGQSPDSSSYNDKKEGIPFYQGNADFGEKHPIPRVWCNAPTKIAQPKDILMSVRAPIGALNYAQEKCCIGRGLAAITPDKDKLSLEFLYWFLRGKNSELNSKGTGSTFKAISKKTLEEIRVPLIDLEKQQKMAQALEKTYSVIQMRTKQLKELDDLIKALFVEMFGDPVYSAIDSKIELSDICEKITDGEHGSVARVANGHPFLNAKHILKTGFIDWKTITYIGDEDHQRIYKRCNPEKGDILLTTTGTIGNVAIMPECEEVSMDRGITLLKINRHKVTSEFVAEMLKHPSIQMAMGANVHASAIGHLFMNKVKKLPAILPSMKKQIEFTTFVQQIDKSKLLSGCRLFHSWAPENRDKPKHVGVPRRRTKDLRGGRRQQ